MIINSMLTGGGGSSSSSQVGDMLYTERKPDMSKWLECNGAQVSPKDYPELFGVLGVKYGNTGLTAKAIITNLSSSYFNPAPIATIDGKFICESHGTGNSNSYYRYIYDPSTSSVTGYRPDWSKVMIGSIFKNTAVTLPNGDIICQLYKNGYLTRISNITDSSNVTYTQVPNLTFGSHHSEAASLTRLGAEAQIIYDEANSRYLVLAPINNVGFSYNDEDYGAYWTAGYALYSTTDFSTFTTIANPVVLGSYSAVVMRLLYANGIVFIVNTTNKQTYRLSGSSFTKVGNYNFQDIVYYNGYYYAIVEGSNLYYADSSLSFSVLYTPANYYGWLLGGGTANSSYSSMDLNFALFEGKLLVHTFFPYTDYRYVTMVTTNGTTPNFIKVLSIWSLDYGKPNEIFWITASDGVGAAWNAEGSQATYFYGSAINPITFQLPSASQAYGVSTYYTTTSPTPYIRAKD